jgi:hypothetical protein
MFKWILNVVKLLFFSVLALAAGAVLMITFPSLKSEGPATWLQAIGAWVAAAIALLIFKRQVSRDERRKWDEKTQELQAILFIAQDSLGAVMGIIRRLEKGEWAHEIEPSEMVALQTANFRLETIPLHECPSAGTISAIFGLQSTIKEVTNFIAEHPRFKLEDRPWFINTLNEHLQAGAVSINSIKEALRLARENMIETVV